MADPSELAKVHQKLTEFGVGIKALSTLTYKDAMQLLNYKRNQLRDSIDSEDMDFYYDSMTNDFETRAT